MQGFQLWLKQMVYTNRPIKDTLLIFVSLAAATSIDLTEYPELLAVLAYELMLLAAAGAIIHLFFMRRLKKQLA